MKMRRSFVMSYRQLWQWITHNSKHVYVCHFMQSMPGRFAGSGRNMPIVSQWGSRHYITRRQYVRLDDRRLTLYILSGIYATVVCKETVWKPRLDSCCILCYSLCLLYRSTYHAPYQVSYKRTIGEAIKFVDIGTHYCSCQILHHWQFLGPFLGLCFHRRSRYSKRTVDCIAVINVFFHTCLVVQE